MFIYSLTSLSVYSPDFVLSVTKHTPDCNADRSISSPTVKYTDMCILPLVPAMVYCPFVSIGSPLMMTFPSIGLGGGVYWVYVAVFVSYLRQANHMSLFQNTRHY